MIKLDFNNCIIWQCLFAVFYSELIFLTSFNTNFTYSVINPIFNRD